MKILDLSVMRGPNYWSATRHNLIIMKLDLEDLEYQPSNLIPGFLGRLKEMLPSLIDHRCSEGCRGGFFKRVEEGTWMGHIVEHIALELQALAGMEVGFGRTRVTGRKGVYDVVFSYRDPEAGLEAGKMAVALAEAVIAAKSYDVDKAVSKLADIYRHNKLGPSTAAIVEEAERRGIPWKRNNEDSLITFGYGKNQKKIQASITENTSAIAVDTACNKEDTYRILRKASIPVPEGKTASSVAQVHKIVKEIGFPLATKPLDGNHGRGVTIGIKSEEEAIKGFLTAQKISKDVIVERFIEGFDHRILVINHKFVAAARRTPAYVKGDGVSTIARLVEITNKDPRRGDGHENAMTKIVIDQLTLDVLKKKGLSLDSIVSEGEIVYLKDTANLSTGGTSTDVTDIIHPYNVFLAERISRLIGLDICGIDMMTSDISLPLTETKGAILEVNAAPGLRMHIAPGEGTPRNVAAPIVDMLFEDVEDCTIPIIAVTGTNGKTTTTRLIAAMAREAGYFTGYTTTDGIFINEYQVEQGDCSGPGSAEMLLADPGIELAVLETARGGILRSGLAFKEADVAVITNISEDHLGLKDIETVRDMARVKQVVADSVKYTGYAILNADDDLVYDMADDLDCNIAFFSMNPMSERIKRHCKKGGLAIAPENGVMTIFNGNWKIAVEKLENIPVTFNGKAEFMTQNAMAAVLAAYTQDMELKTIQRALRSFAPSPETTPGRLNVFKVQETEIIVDYAHNPAGMEAVGKFVKEYSEGRIRTGIVTAVGDRRDEDIVKLGEKAAMYFERIIIRNDKDLRGRDPEHLQQLIMDGIRKVSSTLEVDIIRDELDAVMFAIEKNKSTPSVVVVFTEDVNHILGFVRSYSPSEPVFESTDVEAEGKVEQLNQEGGELKQTA